MTDIGGYYRNPHQSQRGGSARLLREGCTPTTGANGANAATGGKAAPTGDQVLALVPRSQETNPATPGWSLDDLDRAMLKLGVAFVVEYGWANVEKRHAEGLYLALQGDSDRFSDATCSGAFDGDHCIGVHPATSGALWYIDDPLCPDGRWEEKATIQRYAEKFAGRLGKPVRFGVFTQPVPKAAGLHVRIAHGAVVRAYRLGPEGPDGIRCIAKVDGKYGVDERWTGPTTTYAAGKLAPRRTCDKRSGARTIVPTEGPYRDRCIRVGAAGVTAI